MTEPKNDLAEPIKTLKDDFAKLQRVPKKHMQYSLEEARLKKSYKQISKSVFGSKNEKVKADFFRWARARQLFKNGNKFDEWLNGFELKECELEAECVRKMPSGAWPVEPTDIVKYTSRYDSVKQKELYTLYPIRKHSAHLIKSQKKRAKQDEFELEDKLPESEVLRFDLYEDQFVIYFQPLEA